MKKLIITTALMLLASSASAQSQAQPIPVEWLAVGFAPPGSTPIRLLVTILPTGVSIAPFVAQPPTIPAFQQPTRLEFIKAEAMEARSWCVIRDTRRIVVSAFGYRNPSTSSQPEEAIYIPIGAPEMNAWTRPGCATVVSLNRDFDRVDVLIAVAP